MVYLCLLESVSNQPRLKFVIFLLVCLAEFSGIRTSRCLSPWILAHWYSPTAMESVCKNSFSENVKLRLCWRKFFIFLFIFFLLVACGSVWSKLTFFVTKLALCPRHCQLQFWHHLFRNTGSSLFGAFCAVHFAAESQVRLCFVSSHILSATSNWITAIAARVRPKSGQTTRCLFWTVFTWVCLHTCDLKCHMHLFFLFFFSFAVQATLAARSACTDRQTESAAALNFIHWNVCINKEA